MYVVVIILLISLEVFWFFIFRFAVCIGMAHPTYLLIDAPGEMGIFKYKCRHRNGSVSKFCVLGRGPG
jgi:hypothetical protein